MNNAITMLLLNSSYDCNTDKIYLYWYLSVYTGYIYFLMYTVNFINELIINLKKILVDVGAGLIVGTYLFLMLSPGNVIWILFLVSSNPGLGGMTVLQVFRKNPKHNEKDLKIL